MIQVLRIDDRLLHGQVAISWSKAYNISTIIIANDSVAVDEFLKMTLGLAKPVDVELKIETVSNAIAWLIKNQNTRRNIMVIINNLVDAKTIIEAIKIPSLNFGNLRERKGSTRYSPAVTLTDEDVSICRELTKKGIELEIRWIPSDSKVYINKLINK